MKAFLCLVSYFAGGGALNINIVILTFLVPGLLLIRNTREYLTQITGGASAAYGIIIQFPFYGGIMGIMVGSGLATIANFFVTISSADTLPFWAFISGGLINMFVPSGGGQWAVQGPIMIEAADGLNAAIAKIAMGVAWGDAWTNMVQPFWTLPLLAIAGLGIRGSSSSSNTSSGRSTLSSSLLGRMRTTTIGTTTASARTMIKVTGAKIVSMTGITPICSCLVADLTGSYGASWLGLAGWTAVGITLGLLTREPREGAKP